MDEAVVVLVIVVLLWLTLAIWSYVGELVLFGVFISPVILSLWDWWEKA